MATRKNERSWAIDVISWIKSYISEGKSVFQDATGEEGLIVESGRTKFPDVILFTDKISGIIFNGWELKLPDTEADDFEMLENALEKAKSIGSNSFVTWNGNVAIIWAIGETYTPQDLKELVRSEPLSSVQSRDDIANASRYRVNQQALRDTLFWILSSLNDLYLNEVIKPAVNISEHYIQSVVSTAEIVIPQIAKSILDRKRKDRDFQREFKRWNILEKQTLNILNNSSRYSSKTSPEEVLARFTYYKIIGKTLFYFSLAENLPARLNPIVIQDSTNTYIELNEYFESAKTIDYQALFNDDFTDHIELDNTANLALSNLISNFTKVSFKLLPSEVIGNILENLVPKRERQKFGQYFTSPPLALLVTMSAIRQDMQYVMDPTSGTGTFLSLCYSYFKWSNPSSSHQEILEKVWGNDVSHFPSVLSVINLYKQEVSETNNYPRVMREDFMNVMPLDPITLPNPTDFQEKLSEPLPEFDAIVGNFPFIQQEDIPKPELKNHFEHIFRKDQNAFIKNKKFNIPSRSDYYIYCFYQSYIHLADDGMIAAITSNAWLGKEYAHSFKEFLLDNFHIKYIAQSNAEHWFTESEVSTIFVTLEKNNSKVKKPSRFITFTNPIDEIIKYDTPSNEAFQNLESIYTEIEMCNEGIPGWKQSNSSSSIWINEEIGVQVSIVEQEELAVAFINQENWKQFFSSPHIMNEYNKRTISSPNNHVEGKRGGRTDWNKMFIIPANKIAETGIESDFLVPLLKSPTQLQTLIHDSSIINHFQFVCSLPEGELKANYPGAYKWINRFKTVRNTNGSKTIPEACSNNTPYWYSFTPSYANIVTAVNPEKKLFFSYFPDGVAIDQRLIGIDIINEERKSLIAALYNSTYCLYILELQGTPRYLGALDLNSNTVKNFRILDPSIPTSEEVDLILKKYSFLTQRNVLPIYEEVRQNDRKEFDTIVHQIFDIQIDLPTMYDTLEDLSYTRVNLKHKE